MAKNAKQREELAAKVSVVTESVSSCHVEEEDSVEIDRREMAHSSSALSLGHGCFRTLPSYSE